MAPVRRRVADLRPGCNDEKGSALGDVDLTIVDAKNDSAKQVGQVENSWPRRWTRS